MSARRRFCAALFAALALALALAGCGYHVAGRSSSMPAGIHTIAVPAFENKTTRYRIEQRLTEATVREFLSKTRYRVVPDERNADAVVRGKVVSLEATPILFDTTSTTVRATMMLVTVRCEVTLEELSTKKPLYHNANFLFRNEYEITADVKSFFEEQDPALERMSREFATRLVAAITENY